MKEKFGFDWKLLPKPAREVNENRASKSEVKCNKTSECPNDLFCELTTNKCLIWGSKGVYRHPELGLIAILGKLKDGKFFFHYVADGKTRKLSVQPGLKSECGITVPEAKESFLVGYETLYCCTKETFKRICPFPDPRIVLNSMSPEEELKYLAIIFQVTNSEIRILRDY